MSQANVLRQTIDCLSDQRFRLNHLYWIRDENGVRTKFQMNEVQSQFYDDMHMLNVILKARQLGFTTFIQLYMLDTCLFNSNIKAGTVAHRESAAKEIFRDKVKYAYDNLPDDVKAFTRPGPQDSANMLSFANGSSIMVDTSIRSGTVQLLHISEFGKLCSQFPERAREVITGTLNALHAGNMGFIESTAEGREGKFYDMCQVGMKLQQSGKLLTALDWKLHFYPWFRRPSYVLEGDVVITAEDRAYFDGLEAELTPEQRAWYVKKKETQGDDMKREFPSTPDEAFEAAIEGAYYASEFRKLRERKQITRVPWEPSVQVNTFWDLGIDDEMAIWFHQRVGKENRLIDYYANSGEGFAHYAKVLKEKDYTYGSHYLPHDVEVAELTTGQARKATLLGLGVKPIKTVARTKDVGDDIQTVRNWLLSCWFDEENCAEGIKALEHYRKDWSEKLGTFLNRPRHDWASHGADSFRTGAVGWKEPVVVPFKKRPMAWVR